MPSPRSRAPRLRAVLLVGTAAVLFPTLAGCSGGGSPEATVQSFYQRYSDGDVSGACELLAEDGVPLDETGKQQCEAFLNLAQSSDDKLLGKSFAVATADVDGNRATVPDDAITADGESVGDSNSSPMELELIDGTWYITDLG